MTDFAVAGAVLGPDHPASPRIEILAHRLQETLEALRSRAEHLAGDMFDHEALFCIGGEHRLDATLAEIVEELRSLCQTAEDI